MTDIEQRLRYVEDRLAIEDLVRRYASTMDRRRYEDWVECFTDDVALNYSWGRTVGREGLAERIRWLLEPFGYGQHVIANLEVEIDGDRAKGRANFIATLVRRDHPDHKYWQEGGYYLHEYRRTPDGWRFSRIDAISKWWSPAMRRDPPRATRETANAR